MRYTPESVEAAQRKATDKMDELAPIEREVIKKKMEHICNDEKYRKLVAQASKVPAEKVFDSARLILRAIHLKERTTVQ